MPPELTWEEEVTQVLAAGADPDPDKLAAVLQALGLMAEEVLAAQDLNNGPHWLGLLIDSVDSLLALEPDHAALKRLDALKVNYRRADGTPAVTEKVGRGE